MKTILTLRGPGNRGKTTSLCMLIALLKEKFPSAVVQERRYKWDITITVTINGKRVGIETQGDPNSRLKKSLDIFIQVGCEIIVCASRSSGQTVDIIKAVAARGYRLKWFEKLSAAGEREQLASNQATADEMFNAVLQAVDA